MGSLWYWLRPDHSIEKGPDIEDRVGFAEYAEWLYGGLKTIIPNKVVARTEIGDKVVSTIFLGLDHGFGANHRPVLFETVIFIDGHGEEGWRYCTWDEAVAGHKRVCDSCASGLSRKELETGEQIILSLLKDK